MVNLIQSGNFAFQTISRLLPQLVVEAVLVRQLVSDNDELISAIAAGETPDFEKSEMRFDISIVNIGTQLSTTVPTPIDSETRRVSCRISNVPGLDMILQSDYLLIDDIRWEILSDNFTIGVDPTGNFYQFYIKKS